MKEKLYMIPVNDAFSSDCECPLCAMYKTLEDNAIDYTLGPSYMEDDVREETDKVGFCSKHIKNLYGNQNRLGLALMMKTHMDKTINDMSQMLVQSPKVKSNLFKKTVEENPLSDYVKTLSCSCFVCNRIDQVFDRYVDTVIHMYKTDESFRKKFSSCKGFCTEHFENLYTAAHSQLSEPLLSSFINELNSLYMENMKRVRDDLDWFINKFDYRYANEPWKNSKDALIRTVQKTNHTFLD